MFVSGHVLEKVGYRLPMEEVKVKGEDTSSLYEIDTAPSDVSVTFPLCATVAMVLRKIFLVRESMEYATLVNDVSECFLRGCALVQERRGPSLQSLSQMEDNAGMSCY